MRRTRPAFRGLAHTCLVIGGIAAVALFVLGAVEGCGASDDYGRVSVPGKGTLQLPQGDVALYYEEHVKLQENDSLDVPENLRVTARREVTVRAERTTENAINLENRSLRQYAKLAIPQAGRYRIRVRGTGSNTPAVTFGESLTKGMVSAMRNAGIAIGAGVVLWLLLMGVGRIGYTPEPAVQYVPQPPTPPPSAPRSVLPWAGQPAKPEDPAQKLARLEQLRSQGALSDEEYRRMRDELLGSV